MENPYIRPTPIVKRNFSRDVTAHAIAADRIPVPAQGLQSVDDVVVVHVQDLRYEGVVAPVRILHVDGATHVLPCVDIVPAQGPVHHVEDVEVTVATVEGVLRFHVPGQGQNHLVEDVVHYREVVHRHQHVSLIQTSVN